VQWQPHIRDDRASAPCTSRANLQQALLPFTQIETPLPMCRTGGKPAC
jgi:hypothetical protein